MSIRRIMVFAALFAACACCLADTPPAADKADPVDFQWGVKIPLRDGVKLNATLYRPQAQKDALPCVFTLTPYIAQSYHERGMYFAAHGYVFVTVDVRGRGNSEGEFAPLLQEARDGHDVVEWLAGQKYCNGKVTMWGGSYAGYDQWATAKELPPHLATIVPVASPFAGVDFPRRNNIAYPYDMQWLTFTSGRTGQEKIFEDGGFWIAKFKELYLGHRAFKDLDALIGNPSSTFQTWIAHPAVDAYWDGYNPTAEQFAKIDLPILTVTGQYDGDQPGALTFYRQHMAHGTAHAKAQHYLIIGPWDHPGTRTPRAEVGGLKFGNASLLDMNKLHRDWYDWTMKSGPRPEFLKDRVAYYVLGNGAEDWRYAGSLDAVTAESRPLYLASQDGHANDVFASGSLDPGKAGGGKSDHYVYDPLDTSSEKVDGAEVPNMLTDQRWILQQSGKYLVYHTAPFAKYVEIAGFFKLSAYIALDQPDTDFHVSVFEIQPDGNNVFLSDDMLRARYREGDRVARPVAKGKVELYDFNRFTFAARRIQAGSRLRLVIAPMNTLYSEKNYNSGGVIADETGKDARTVNVSLVHDGQHPSALFVPIAAEVAAEKK
ncbi:MAG: CocE/NonD family hydrolase [Rudaea sp.]|nr:CocE/NonD family hydrolase [Rudaea sp.]